MELLLFTKEYKIPELVSSVLNGSQLTTFESAKYMGLLWAENCLFRYTSVEERKEFAGISFSKSSPEFVSLY